MLPSPFSIANLEPVFYRFRGATCGQKTPGSQDISDEDIQEPRQRLYCVTCGHVITDDSQRIVMGGGHEHTFFNPHGVLFHLGCFRNAPGCMAQGPPSAEFSWFPGTHWLLVFCARCRNHLGWRFQGGVDGPFFGLILNRISTRDEGDDG